MSAVPVTRRHFLKVTVAAGGGMLIGFCIPDAEAATVQPQPWTALPEGVEINAWLAIDSEATSRSASPTPRWGRAPSPPSR
jgi:hypothetical protein